MIVERHQPSRLTASKFGGELGKEKKELKVKRWLPVTALSRGGDEGGGRGGAKKMKTETEGRGAEKLWGRRRRWGGMGGWWGHMLGPGVGERRGTRGREGEGIYLFY